MPISAVETVLSFYQFYERMKFEWPELKKHQPYVDAKHSRIRQMLHFAQEVSQYCRPSAEQQENESLFRFFDKTAVAAGQVVKKFAEWSYLDEGGDICLPDAR